jgi:protein-disulfide isomerase
MHHWLTKTCALILLPLCILLWGCAPAQTSTSLSDQEFEAKVLEVIRKNPKAIIESVQAYNREQQQKAIAAREQLRQQLKTEPRLIVRNSPVKGSPELKIVLVEFSDFQCPFCARAHSTVKEFMAKYGQGVSLTYKHLPLTEIHPQALPAALASWSAQQQGKFWEYHDALFNQQANLGEDLYVRLANELGLDIAKFNSDRHSESAQNAINQDIELAQGLGINGTPTFIMNGIPFAGAVSLADMERVLQEVKTALAPK